MTAITTLPKIGLMLASPPKAGELVRTLVGTHAFDTKVDGIRCLATYDGFTPRLLNRSGVDITARYPEIAKALVDSFNGVPIVLDGEIVALSGSFQDTAKRDKQANPNAVVAAMKTIPVVFLAFDLLVLPPHGIDIRDQPWDLRRGLLDRMAPQYVGPIQNTPVGYDLAFVDTVKQLGMEGVIAKRMNSTYRTGRFSDWAKYKNVQSITCIGIGYEAGQGARAHFGAMFLALIDTQAGTTIEVGRVGTGFKAADIAELKGELDAGRLVVVEIECLNKSRDNKLRFPSFKGIRTDLSVADATVAQLATLPTM